MGKRIFLFVCFVGLSFIFGKVVLAEPVTLITDIYIDEPTISRGFTARSGDNNFRLGIYPEVLAKETRVVIKQFDKTLFEYPSGWSPISDVYEFDIFNKAAFRDDRPLKIQIQTGEETTHLKKIFFWNGASNEWVELPSDVAGHDLMRSVLHLPYAKMAVLKHETILQIGDASWYKYKNCLCAASPDYPKGSLLQVKDLDSGKTVIVKVNDYGPDRSLFPFRVIDLDRVAFSELGKLSWGILKNIAVTKIK